MAAFNKFSLLNDDADGSSAPSLKSKAAATTTQAPAAPAADTASKGGRTQGPASRSGRYYARGGAVPGSGKPAEPQVTDESAVPPARFDRTEGRRGRGRGGPRTAGAASKDRHSRTAIVDSDKQVNQGWGADTGRAELSNEVQAEADASAEINSGEASWGQEGGASWGDAEAPAGDAAAAPAAEGEKKDAKPVQEEDNTITYQEYLAQKSGAALTDLVGNVGPRKANEGKDMFKDVTKFERDEEDEAYFVGKTKSSKTKTRGDKPEKVTIEIDGQFSEPPGGGRGRGRGRGGGRGGERGGDFRGGRGGGGGGERRGRGGFRGGYSNGPVSPSVDVDDTSSFPTLGGKK